MGNTGPVAEGGLGEGQKTPLRQKWSKKVKVFALASGQGPQPRKTFILGETRFHSCLGGSILSHFVLDETHFCSCVGASISPHFVLVLHETHFVRVWELLFHHILYCMKHFFIHV